MQLTVHGRNVEVTDWVREYVENKVTRLERYLPQMKEIRAELTQRATRSADDRYTAQVTVWAGGQILRAEESTSDIFASIDATIDKMAKQVRRFKGRRYDSKRRAAAAASMEVEMNGVVPVGVEEAEEAEVAAGQVVDRDFLVTHAHAQRLAFRNIRRRRDTHPSIRHVLLLACRGCPHDACRGFPHDGPFRGSWNATCQGLCLSANPDVAPMAEAAS